MCSAISHCSSKHAAQAHSTHRAKKSAKGGGGGGGGDVESALKDKIEMGAELVDASKDSSKRTLESVARFGETMKE